MKLNTLLYERWETRCASLQIESGLYRGLCTRTSGLFGADENDAEGDRLLIGGEWEA